VALAYLNFNSYCSVTHAEREEVIDKTCDGLKETMGFFSLRKFNHEAQSASQFGCLVGANYNALSGRPYHTRLHKFFEKWLKPALPCRFIRFNSSMKTIHRVFVNHWWALALGLLLGTR